MTYKDDISNDEAVYIFPISIIYKDKNYNTIGYNKPFDINKVEYHDDYCLGEKFLARHFNKYLDFNMLKFRGFNRYNYPIFIINIRKIKIKKILSI